MAWISPNPDRPPNLGLESLAHLTTGIVFWLVFWYNLPQEERGDYFDTATSIAYTFLAGLLAVAVDVDHFIAAGSFTIDVRFPLLHSVRMIFTGNQLLTDIQQIVSLFSGCASSEWAPISTLHWRITDHNVATHPCKPATHSGLVVWRLILAILLDGSGGLEFSSTP